MTCYDISKYCIFTDKYLDEINIPTEGLRNTNTQSTEVDKYTVSHISLNNSSA